MLIPFENEYVSLNITIIQNKDEINIKGNVKPGVLGLSFIAACPIDRMSNYTGSGQPFANSKMAFENTPNSYTVNSPAFEFNFKYPNSFYDETAFEKIISSVFISYNGKLTRIELPDKLELKTLTYRKEMREKGPFFYDREEYMPIPNSQYDQLLSISFAKKHFGIA